MTHNVASAPRRGVASWLLLALLLVAGGWIMLLSWRSLIAIGTNYGLAPTPGTNPWQVAMYALPGFEGGLLIGVLMRASTQGCWHAIKRLTTAVWIGVLLNFLSIGLLRPY